MMKEDYFKIMARAKTNPITKENKQKSINDYPLYKRMGKSLENIQIYYNADLVRTAPFIRDQGRCGLCVAFAAVSIEWFYLFHIISNPINQSQQAGIVESQMHKLKGYIMPASLVMNFSLCNNATRDLFEDGLVESYYAFIFIIY